MPAGLGKTTISKKYKNIYDIDSLIKSSISLLFNRKSFLGSLLTCVNILEVII